ncbi:MAG: ABC transporter ATP-binding protein [Planctomycetes bacterium]|nr:ABC transporter ATP-binding protein [Planctomycetota bacterium]
MSDADRYTENRVGGAQDRLLLKRMLAFARPHAKALAATIVLLVSGLLLRLAGPWIVRAVIDGPVAEARRTRGTPQFDQDALLAEVTRWGVVFLAVTLAFALSLVAREWLMNRTGQRIVLAIRNTLFHHTLRLPVSWFDKHHVGWTVTRTTSDVDALSELFTTGVATIAYDIMTIVVVIVVLMTVSPSLALVTLLILPAMVFVSFRFRLNARMAYRATRHSLSQLNGFLQERLTGLDVVHLFRRERASEERFAELNRQYYDDNMVTVKHFSLFFPVVDSLSWAVRVGTIVWGSWLVLGGSLSLGDFVMFWMLLDYVFEPIRELAERYNVLQSAMAAGERIFGILDAAGERGALSLEDEIAAADEVARRAADDTGGTPSLVPAAVVAHATPRPPRGTSSRDEPAVVFEHVSFGYVPGEDVLHDVSFEIRPGQRVAVVGHTGAGKTTLVGLLCRFYECDRGRISVGGRDVRELEHDDLRRRIAIVQQDVFLFSDTIDANIRLGDPSLPRERVAAMAGAVNADRFIERLPEGYATRLLERGSNLSSGQRQLLAFARALAADPEILVLDEATSSVDSETEAWIEDATATLMRGRTSLVIAHRLSTIVGADLILVMHKGRLHEQGTHDELLAQRGLYHKLYHLHLAGAH